jgi:hypothetical protein
MDVSVDSRGVTLLDGLRLFTGKLVGYLATTRAAGESFVGPRDGKARRRSERVTPDTAVWVLLDVVLLGGAGSIREAVICDVHAGIRQSDVAAALVARNKALAAFRTLMKCRGGWDVLCCSCSADVAAARHATSTTQHSACVRLADDVELGDGASEIDEAREHWPATVGRAMVRSVVECDGRCQARLEAEGDMGASRSKRD